MTARYPLVLNGTTVQEIQSGDTAIGLTSGTSILKGDGATGIANAIGGTDYQTAQSVTGIVKSSGTTRSAAVSGVDYAPPTSGSSILYGNAAGGFNNVTVGSGLSFSAGTLSNSSPSPIPAGTVTNFFQAAAPTGWTQCTTHNNKAIRIVSGTGGGTGGSVGFTTAFASQAVAGTVGISGGSVSAATLSTCQIPSHSHLHRYATGTNCGSGVYSLTRGANLLVCLSIFNTGITTTSTGGGGSHTHGFTNPTGSFSGTAINLAVQYVDNIIATKN